MLSKETIDKEIQQITDLMAEIEDALASEEDLNTRVGLSSAFGQLRIARSWLYNLKGGV